MIHAQEQYQLGGRAVACLLLAGLADFLFYMEGMGWAVGIYTFIISWALLFFNPGLAHTKPGKVIIAINCVLVLALVENPSGLTISLSFLGITSIALLSHPGWTHNAGLWLRGIFDFWTQNVFRVIDDAKLLKNLFQEKDNPNRSGIQLRNWILPLGLSLVFVTLFAGANPILIRWLDLINWNWIADLFTFERILLWSLVIILCWPLLQPRFWLKQNRMGETDSQEIRNLFHFLFSKKSFFSLLILFNLIGLSLFFLILFAIINPMMIDWILTAELFAPKQIPLWSLVIILSWLLLRSKLRLKQEPIQKRGFKDVKTLIHFLFSKESILYSLILFNLLFSVQTSMDLIYLWGGMALPEGMSYSEYAHRGAYPLIATALLAGAFVLVALRPGSATEGIRSIRYLVYFWIGQTVFLVLSSIWRTTLYIEEYSLTYLRLAALIWMGLVALGLVLLVLRILWTRSNIWLINVNGLTLLTVLMLCAFINLGGVIAQFNVEHCKEVRGKGPVLDLKYLREIGTASLPALDWFQQHGRRYNYKMLRAGNLERNLRNTLRRELREWRTWTFRSYRLSRNSGTGSKLSTSPVLPAG